MIELLPVHGERSTYRKGCRCLACKAANAQYINSRRIAVLTAAKLEMDQAELETGSRKVASWQHGILPTAIGKGCRCDECKPLVDEYRSSHFRKSKTRRFVDEMMEVFVNDRPAANE